MVIAQACSIKIVERARLHPVLAKYKTMMEDYRVKLKEAKSNPYYNPRNKPDGEPVFFLIIRKWSEENDSYFECFV